MQSGQATQPTSVDVKPRQVPILDLTPRRIWLQDLHRDSHPREIIRLLNRGGDTLIGHLKITQGTDWLALADGAGNGAQLTTMIPVETTREQQIQVVVDPSRLTVPGDYLARLELRTNAGTLEIPVQADLRATPFPDQDPHWAGVTSPRELGRRMVEAPRKAIQILNEGQLVTWFRANGWDPPWIDRLAPGMGAVQQFLEHMRLATVPDVTFLPDENAPHVQPASEAGLAYECLPTDGIIHGAIKIGTSRKKWVYAFLESDMSWLALVEEAVVGPQSTIIRFMIDSEALQPGPNEGTIRIRANGEQELNLTILAERRRLGDPFTRRLVRGLGFSDD